MRPALYNAKHNIIPVLKLKKKINGNVEFVGPICESTDTFVKYRNYSLLNENNLVAITNVGAYGSSLSSNYNTRLLPSEVLVNKDLFGIIYSPNKIEKNIEEYIIPNWL